MYSVGLVCFDLCVQNIYGTSWFEFSFSISFSLLFSSIFYRLFCFGFHSSTSATRLGLVFCGTLHTMTANIQHALIADQLTIAQSLSTTINSIDGGMV